MNYIKLNMRAKKKILFLCTGNSCRSQMAEGWARHLLGDKVKAYSAGVEKHGLNKYAVSVMSEAGIDISHHRSKHIEELADISFDWVITVCDNARESCPVFPRKVRMIHRSFSDPPKLALCFAGEEDKLNCYRKVRDEIREFVLSLRKIS